MPLKPIAVRQSHALFESLESRSLLSASPFVAIHDGVPVIPASSVTASAVKATATALKVYGNTSVVGQPITLRAVVTSVRNDDVPNGTVTFKAAGVTLGTGTLVNGVAKISTKLLPFGKSVVVATYSGSNGFATSVSAGRRHVATKSVTSIKLGLASEAAVFGTPVALVARVANVTTAAGVPFGRVTFYDGNKVIGSRKLSSLGAARIIIPNFYINAHSLKAIYGGSTASQGHRSGVRTLNVSIPTFTDSSTGLRTATTVTGSGPVSTAGSVLTANYTGFLTDGTRFESSLDPGRSPFSFQLGTTPKQVIAGFDEGLTGVKAGETRVLVIPPNLGYGATANGNIPANSTLVFIVSVLTVA